MPTIFSYRLGIIRGIITFALILLLSACGSLISTNSSELLKKEAHASSDFYLQQAQKTPNEVDKYNYELIAVRVLLKENKLNQAEALLATLLENNTLNSLQTAETILLHAHILALENQNEEAFNLLNTLIIANLSPAQKARYWQTMARIQLNKNALMESVRSLIQAESWIEDNELKQQNINQIWLRLRHINAGLLNTLPTTNDMTLMGWLELIKTYNNNLYQPENLSNAITQWQTAYPNHSAAHMLPSELQNVLYYRPVPIHHIALLLPLSGNAKPIGDIIVQGFTDAQGGDNTIKVSTYDTMSGKSISDLLSQARKAGADAIVGPLIKPNVSTITQLNTKGLQILTLNSTENSLPATNICYYGLSPEAEARSAADKMWLDNIRTPLLMVPQNNLGQRSAAAFNLRWQQLSGIDAQTQFYSDSKEIIIALESGLASVIDNPAPAVYIVANNQELLDIKNAINNTGYTGRLPIYATSRSNNPNNGPDYRLTMNGLKFSEIPLLAGEKLNRRIIDLAEGDYSMIRLYAMGADAWLLINKFNEIRQIPGYTLSGLTGELTAGNGCHIDQTMKWLEYRHGRIVPIK